MTRPRRILAARYLRTLATIEHLSALGNDSEVRRLLAGIDPIEARELANEIEQDTPRTGLMAVWEETLEPGKVIPLPGGYSVRVGA